MKLESGRSEIDFNDSYRFNIAAYELAELVGLDNMFAGLCGTQNGRANPVPSVGGCLSRWTKPSAWKRRSRFLIPTSGISRCFESAFSTNWSTMADPQSHQCTDRRRLDCLARRFQPGPSTRTKSYAPRKNLVKCDRELFEKLKALNADGAPCPTSWPLDQDPVQRAANLRRIFAHHPRRQAGGSREPEARSQPPTLSPLAARRPAHGRFLCPRPARPIARARGLVRCKQWMLKRFSVRFSSGRVAAHCPSGFSVVAPGQGARLSALVGARGAQGDDEKRITGPSTRMFLIHDPHAFLKFEDNDVILPIYVIEEIDQFKTRRQRAWAQRAHGLAPASTRRRAKGPPVPRASILPDGGTLARARGPFAVSS